MLPITANSKPAGVVAGSISACAVNANPVKVKVPAVVEELGDLRAGSEINAQIHNGTIFTTLFDNADMDVDLLRFYHDTDRDEDINASSGGLLATDFFL